MFHVSKRRCMRLISIEQLRDISKIALPYTEQEEPSLIFSEGGEEGGGGGLYTGYSRVDGFSLTVPTQKLKIPWRGLAGLWKHISSRDL